MKVNNKFTIVLVFIFAIVCIFAFSDKVFASDENVQNDTTLSLNSVFDIKGINGEYKVSDEKSDIYLPFFRNAVENITVDKNIDKIGIFSSAKIIEVKETMKNLQVLFAKDTVRVNSNMEYALIWSGNDVVIDSNIQRNAIIFAGGTVTITDNATIGDDTIIIAKAVNVKGKINSSAIIESSTIDISGSIKKDLRCDVDNITISSNNNVDGNIYIGTYNNNLDVKQNYPNAIVNIKESKSTSKSFLNILLRCVINCLLFTLLYLILKKITSGKIYENMLQKAKNNTLFVVLSSSITLLAFPAIFIFLVLLSILGLYMLTIPIAIVYCAFLVVFVMLSIFVVGSTVFEYTNKKYIKANKVSMELLGVFSTFLSLSLLEKIPFIGGYISMLIIIISVGIVLACVFKRNKKQEKIKSEK